MDKDGLRLSKRRRGNTDKQKALAAKALAQKVGYLRVDEFPDTSLFDSLPRLRFKAGRRIQSKDNLYVVKSGSVIIKHAHYNYFVKELTSGVLFGNLPLLGQTMTITDAIAGSGGAMLGVLNTNAVKQWIAANPIALLEKLGPRLSKLADEYYRASFQLIDSRLAALLLELAGDDSIVKGLSQTELGELIGIYRESVTTTLSMMESNKLIKVGRRKVALLDKQGLRELSEY